MMMITSSPLFFGFHDNNIFVMSWKFLLFGKLAALWGGSRITSSLFDHARPYPLSPITPP